MTQIVAPIDTTGRQHRRTKIVATVGPASRSAERIRQLIVAGVDVFRLNFSHGKQEEHADVVKLIRQAAQDLQRPIAIMQDLQGPKIRISDIVAGEIPLKVGAQLRLVSGHEPSTAERVYISYPHVADDVPPGATILVDDGKLEFRAVSAKDGAVVCEVVLGGVLKPHKGVNFPGVPLRINALSEKDKDDMLFGTTLGVDFVAISFVQRASDILEAKDYLESFGKKTPIVAKIERQEAINNLDDIIAVTDAVMVARGDLGVETPAEMVPMYQKRIIAKCNEAGKPVITATQMLDSMVTAPRPTRAEASDVANAILDGTDAVMLSNETAVGDYPIEAVRTMARIAVQAEPVLTANLRASLRTLQDNTVSMAISAATCQIASALGATAIITATHSGSTARQVSKYRPQAAILAATPSEDTYRRMSLVWGVTPMLIAMATDTDTLFQTVIDAASAGGMLHEGDTVVISAGVPMGQPGTTNLIKVESVSTILAHGAGLGQRVVTGRAVLCPSAAVAEARVGPGDILVAPATDRDYIHAMQQCAALVVEQGGLTSHAAIAALSLGIPVIVGVANALAVIPDGQVITIDPKRGLIVAGRPKSL